MSPVPLLRRVEPVPAPVLPQAGTAQSTHLSHAIRGVPVALSPDFALRVVALLNEGAPALTSVSSDRMFPSWAGNRF